MFFEFDLKDSDFLLIIQQDRQCTYNVMVRHVCAIIVAVEK